jgi:hypothetical protein
VNLPSLFNFARISAPPDLDDHIEIVQTQNPLRRVLSFTGHTIDDVINNPIARSKVRCYFKLHRWVERESLISDLERQWNALSRIDSA